MAGQLKKMLLLKIIETSKTNLRQETYIPQIQMPQYIIGQKKIGLSMWNRKK